MPLSDNREDRILREAQQWLAAERAAYLHGACGGDAGLRQRIEARLAAQGQAGDQPATQATPGPRGDKLHESRESAE